jgi:DNA repair protein RecO (recombination protein O)
MHHEKTEGIVLRSQDYKERHRIVTLFTPQGLISLIVRGISRKNARLLTLTTPFCQGEYHYASGASELRVFKDGSVINDHYGLRKDLKTLQAAGSIASAILTSQMPGKPSPALFVLLKSYQAQVPLFTDPEVLLASFYLKLLKHEGLLTLSESCAVCEEERAVLLHDGESLCTKHSAPQIFRFSESEWQLLMILDGAQQFSVLRGLCLPPELPQKLSSLFHSRLSH